MCHIWQRWMNYVQIEARKVFTKKFNDRSLYQLTHLHPGKPLYNNPFFFFLTSSCFTVAITQLNDNKVHIVSKVSIHT